MSEYHVWKKKVDAALIKKCGMGIDEIPDWCYMDDFENNLSPVASASRALKNAEKIL